MKISPLSQEKALSLLNELLGRPFEKAMECTGDAHTCPIDECMLCSVRDCPYCEPLHYHHDGCPYCQQRW